MTAARRPIAFKQHDVVRALRATVAAGLTVSRIEIDPSTGKITIATGSEPNPEARGDLDKWLKDHES